MLESHLKRIYGYSVFRPNQREIIENILAGNDVFAVMPTGGGKSLCYQLPATITEGTGIIISPLISLMKDQVDGARDLGIRAEYLNSNLTGREMADVYRMLEGGELDLLYVSPERFGMDSFLETLSRVNISMFAVDEAHCMSEWGHDFRPDYLNLSIIHERFPNVPIAAFTATATNRVQQDVSARLKLRDPFLVRASFNRPNLYYRVEMKTDIRNQLLDFVEEHRDVAGIIYRTSRKDVDATVTFLCANGIKAKAYHAGLTKQEREDHQNAFNRDEINVIVATIAFGMGIDKSNVRYVVHGDLPKNMEGYYQETGRAGRDGDPSLCVLFFGRGDIPKIRYFIDQMTDAEEQKIAKQKLHGMADYADLPVCRRKQLLAYFGEHYPDPNCGGCDICVQEVEKADDTKPAQMLMSAVARVKEMFHSDHILDIVTGNDTEMVLAQGHHELPTFGVGREQERAYWEKMLRSLLDRDCVRGDADMRLMLTDKGRNILFGRDKFHVLRGVEGKKRQHKAPVEKKEKDRNEDLFERLRQLRRRLADAANVPPYVIFSDNVLSEMSRAMPQRRREMLQISGIGDVKLQKYGDVFIEEIRCFLEDHPECLPEGSKLVMSNEAKKTSCADGIDDEQLNMLIHAGAGLEDITREMQLPLGRLCKALEKRIDNGEELPLDTLLGTGTRLEIERQLERNGGQDSVSAIVRKMNGEVSAEMVKLVKSAMNKVV